MCSWWLFQVLNYFKQTHICHTKSVSALKYFLQRPGLIDWSQAINFTGNTGAQITRFICLYVLKETRISSAVWTGIWLRNKYPTIFIQLQRFFSREKYSNLLLQKFILFYVLKLVTNTMGHHTESKLWRITKQPIFHSIANMKHLICNCLILHTKFKCTCTCQVYVKFKLIGGRLKLVT